MTWWIVCFIATLITIGAKWYFATGLARMRHALSRQQRETLELKGTLQDMRQGHADTLKLTKGKETDIARLKKRIAEQKTELRQKQPNPQDD